MTETPQRRRRSNPTLATLIALVFPGFGQIYNGQFWKGLWYIAAFWLSWLIAVLFAWLIIPIFFPSAVYVYQAFDAYRVANEPVGVAE